MIKKAFLKNAVAVCSVSAIMSILGILFRTYASNRVGSEVMGLLQLILSVYYPACTLASSGIYVASTYLCAKESAHKGMGIRAILNRCLTYGLCFGTAAFVALFFGARFIAEGWLQYPEAEIPLKILSFGLPFLSMANAIQGYFLSLRSAVYSTILQVMEDLSKIGITILLFTLYLDEGPTAALSAMVGGMAVGEILSCVLGYILFRMKSRSNCTPANRKETKTIYPQILQIALPCAFSGYLRSGIGMIENILVPRGLEASGLTAEQTLAAMGKFEGMALPVLIFPAAFLAVISKLLVPEITAENALGNKDATRKTAESVLRWTLVYGMFVGVFALIFGKDLGKAIYGDPTCGIYITLLAPLVPVMYTDRVIDGIVKGYNRQLDSMKINLMDTLLQTLGAWLLIPRTGIAGYVALFCGGSLFNFILSFRVLHRTCHIRFPVKDGIFKPLLAALAATLPVKILKKFIPISVWLTLGISILLFLLFSFECLDKDFLHVGSIGKEHRQVFLRNLFRKSWSLLPRRLNNNLPVSESNRRKD